MGTIGLWAFACDRRQLAARVRSRVGLLDHGGADELQGLGELPELRRRQLRAHGLEALIPRLRHDLHAPRKRFADLAGGGTLRGEALGGGEEAVVGETAGDGTVRISRVLTATGCRHRPPRGRSRGADRHGDLIGLVGHVQCICVFEKALPSANAMPIDDLRQHLLELLRRRPRLSIALDDRKVARGPNVELILVRRVQRGLISRPTCLVADQHFAMPHGPLRH
mmetsp:Transcript_23612/g.58867  ORF Transcript_23612/g.58867 Transcript_23612/m.58867 type:complete len:224 (+) Transcript_23612:85-756(+)